jgi:hypothetical protein
VNKKANFESGRHQQGAFLQLQDSFSSKLQTRKMAGTIEKAREQAKEVA